MIHDSDQQNSSESQSPRQAPQNIGRNTLRQMQALEELGSDKESRNDFHRHGALNGQERNKNGSESNEGRSQFSDDDEENECQLGKLLPQQEQERGRKRRENQRQKTFLQKHPQNIAPSIPTQDYQQIVHKQMSLVRQAKPRLIIDKIVLQNFKSYANRQQIGPLHQNFTSIVGPNGSGKSNLIQSMLFIFGYNAAWMRLNRLNQLIHNSAQMKNIPKASVQVTFRKVLDVSQFETQSVPGSQFILRRTINSSSQSKYYINDRQSTQAQVKQHLLACGIDLQNNRFLILQGQVETISQMKQKSGDREHPGLLEYLEDIIGSNQFVEQINLCNEEYGQGEEKKHEKGQMMRMVEGQVKSMAKGKEQAIKFVKIEKRGFQSENVLRQMIRMKTERRLREEQQKLEFLQKERDRVIAQERERMKVQAERVKQLKKNKDQKVIIERRLELEKENLAKQNTKDKHLTQEMSFKSEDVVKYQRRAAQLDTQRQKIIDSSEVLRREIPKKREELEKKIQEYEETKAQLTKHDNPELKQRLKQFEAEIRRNSIQMQTMDQKYQAITKKLTKLQESTTDYSTRLKQLQKKARSDQLLLQQLYQAGKQAKRIHSALSNQVVAKKRQRYTLKQEIEKVDMALREFQSEHKNKNEFNNMFTKIMERKIPGVIGRLGDLGKTSKEFDEIITTACNQLDNIVVRNYDSAKAVVDFLKQEKLGRVSCIILDKISQYKNSMHRSFQPLKNAVRLFDMIESSSQQVRTAFYFVLKDTLYCENSELGMQYSMRDDHQRRRVISRKQAGGYIIYQVNGVMMSSISRRGGFENKGTANTAKKLQRNLDSQAAEIRELQERRTKLQEGFSVIERTITEREKEMANVQNDSGQVNKETKEIQRNLTQTNEDIKQCNRYLQQQIDKSKMSQQNKDKLKQESAAIVERIKTLVQKDDQLKQQIKQLEEERKRKQSGRVTELRQNYRNLKKDYEALEKELEKGEAVLDSTESRIKANDKQRIDLAKKITRLEADVTNLKEQQRQVEHKATEIFGVIARQEERLNGVKETEKKLRIILDEDQKQVKESKKKIEKVKQDVQFCVNECRREEMNLETAVVQIIELRKNYYDVIKQYTFLEDIQQIERMQIFNKNPQFQASQSREQLRNHDHNSSLLDTTSHNISMDSASKNFPGDKIWQTEVDQDLSQHQLQTFITFQQRVRLALKDCKEALGKIQSQNLSIINDFKTKFKDYKLKYDDYQQIRIHQLELRQKIEHLKAERLSLFRHGFGIINTKLKEVYQLLTRGGDAELELIDSLDPFSDGINFSVRPPKKSWKEINKLSGGQKTLSSLSLIFALHFYKPTPLYFMDEIDAALDFKNVSIVAEYIKKRTKNAQFIIISLRNHMFDLADKLVGVYKTFDKTKTILFRPAKYEEKRKDVEKRNGKGKENDVGNLGKVVEQEDNEEDGRVERTVRKD